MSQATPLHNQSNLTLGIGSNYIPISIRIYNCICQSVSLIEPLTLLNCTVSYDTSIERFLWSRKVAGTPATRAVVAAR